MFYRTLGRTGIRVSEIGFGAWAIGGSHWGGADDAASLETLRTACDCGVNFFDTAAVYGRGRSEQLVGKVYRERNKSFTIATKIPPKNFQWPPSPGTPLRDVFPSGWVRDQTEKSLRNLRVDCIDVQQLHVWLPEWESDPEWYETLVKLRSEGKIKWIGVSLNDHKPDDALSLIQSGKADTIQVIYNIFDQSPEEHLFPLAREKNIGIIARVPLDEGSLTGKFTEQTRFHGDDFRQNYFSPEILPEVVRRVEKLKFIVRKGIPSLAVGALKFCLSNPAVTTVIAGARTPRQEQENTSASNEIQLTPEELLQLKKHLWIREK